MIDRHLERYLGPIERGWRGREDHGIQVCMFRARPLDGVVTYSTLGLSHHLLQMSGARSVRQELLLAARASDAEVGLVNLIMFAAEKALEAHAALLRGEVIHLGYPVSVGSSCNHLYVAIPVAFPDELASCNLTTPPTVLAWLIPITGAEAAYIASSGWDAFETRLTQNEVDLFDLSRESIL